MKDFCKEEDDLRKALESAGDKLQQIEKNRALRQAAEDRVRDGGIPVKDGEELKVDKKTLDADVENAKKKAYAKYGSKIQTLCNLLKRLRSDDPGCKVLVFCQFEDLMGKVISACKELGLSATDLRGRSGEQHEKMQKFQNDPAPGSSLKSASPWVMLLSLEAHAAGANLTAANHVVFLHPMAATTLQKMRTYEEQAIARVRRIGQSREEIHVWRLYTKGTIEEELLREVRTYYRP